MQKYELNNGSKVPALGFGTFKAAGEEVYEAVKEAIRLDYRHIDTASYYHNEKEVGQAIKDSGVKREDIFITSKVWRSDRGYENTLASFNRSIENLGVDYLDCLLIHWPCPITKEDWQAENLDTWRALETLYKEGKVKVIGVSNFRAHHLEALLPECEIKPMMNQIELHPGFRQDETVELCQKENILLEAWEPLAKGAILNDERLLKIAQNHQKSVAQVCIRWSLDNGFLPLPKSVTFSRIKENMEVFDFSLTREEVDLINSFEYIGGSRIDPDKVGC